MRADGCRSRRFSEVMSREADDGVDMGRDRRQAGNLFGKGR
jgi:hypothetical protein